MSAIVIAGDTSGTVTLQAPAVAGTTTITLPTTSAPMVAGNTSTNTAVLFADSGAANGVSGFTFNKANSTLIVANLTLSSTLTSTTNNTVASILSNIVEPTTVSATAATGTINFDVLTQSVIYYTANATANWTVNFRGTSDTTLNSALTTGQTVTVAFLVTQGGTAYYNNLIQIDGANTTAKYQGGTAWSAGNASGIDGYTYSITKTANATYNVLASQTQFK